MSKRSADREIAEWFPLYEPRVSLREQVDLLPAATKAKLFGLSCPPEEDQARQEFKLEADTAYQLARHGAGQAFLRPQSGVMDFDADLQSAIQATNEAKAAFKRLDPELQKRYGSWQAIWVAVIDGSFKAAEAPAGGSGGGSAASASPEGAPA